MRIGRGEGGVRGMGEMGICREWGRMDFIHENFWFSCVLQVMLMIRLE